MHHLRAATPRSSVACHITWHCRDSVHYVPELSRHLPYMDRGFADMNITIYHCQAEPSLSWNMVGPISCMPCILLSRHWANVL
jgi:hypothetical protein